MKISTIVGIALWFILFLALLSVGFEMVSSPSTIENVIGFFIVIATVVITIKTRCLTIIKFKKND